MARSPSSRSTSTESIEEAVELAPEAMAETVPEVVAETVAEAAPVAAPEPGPPVPPARAPLLVPALAGAFGAALGVGVTLFALPYGLRGSEPPLPDPTLSQRIDRLEAQPLGVGPEALIPLEARIAALESQPQAGFGDLPDRIAALESGSAPDLGPLLARLEAVEAILASGLPDSALADRVTALETGIAARAEAAVAEALGTSLAETRAETEARAAELAEAEGQLARRAALAALAVAAESGVPAPEALAALGEVPPALDALAEGLPTQAALEQAFAPAARAALAALPPPEGGSVMQRLGGFLRAQTGARSLAPREGDDPDAVLSRAEAALAARDLAGALAEVETLTGPAAEALAAWRAQARTRHAALAALAELQE